LDFSAFELSVSYDDYHCDALESRVTWICKECRDCGHLDFNSVIDMERLIAATTEHYDSDYHYLVGDARTFAVKAHGDQRYGDLPYVAHLDKTAEEMIRIVAEEPLLQPAKLILIQAAYLHDVLEDTTFALDDFSEDVVALVKAVTDEPGKNRKERKSKTYPKIFSFGIHATAVKLADRIANVLSSRYNDQRLFKMYKDEFEEFEKALRVPGELDKAWLTLVHAFGYRYFDYVLPTLEGLLAHLQKKA